MWKATVFLCCWWEREGRWAWNAKRAVRTNRFRIRAMMIFHNQYNAFTSRTVNWTWKSGFLLLLSCSVLPESPSYFHIFLVCENVDLCIYLPCRALQPPGQKADDVSSSFFGLYLGRGDSRCFKNWGWENMTWKAGDCGTHLTSEVQLCSGPYVFQREIC